MADKIRLEDFAEADEILKWLKAVQIDLAKVMSTMNLLSAESKQTDDALKKQVDSYEKISVAAKKVGETKKKLTEAEKEINKIEALQEKILQSAVGSYTQLDLQLRKTRAEYKRLGDQERNSPVGKEMLKNIQQLDGKLKDFDKTMGMHQRNVGNYASAMEALPGPIGAAKNAVNELGETFKALIKNPVALVITLIVGALTALYKAFTSTDSGGNMVAAMFERMKAVIDVVRQRVAAMAEAIINIFKGNWKEAAAGFKEAFTGIASQLKDAAKAAKDYTYALDALEDAENNYISTRADNENKIAKLEFEAANRGNSIEKRRNALKEAIKISEEETKQAKKFAEEKLMIEVNYLAGKNKVRAEDIISFIKMTDSEQANASDALVKLRNNYEEKFTEIETLYAETIKADTRFFEENKRNISKLSGFEDEINKERLENAKLLAENKMVAESKANDKGLGMMQSIEAKKVEAIKTTFNLMQELQDRQTKKYIEDEKEKQEALKKRREDEKKAFELSVDLANGLFDLQTSFRDAELEDLGAERKYKIEAAGEDKKAIERINKEYDAKELAVKRKQAVADKNQALFNAAINVGVAITKVLGNPFLVALVATLGAIQIASIASKPIPKFATGIKGFGGGLAIAGDAGRELVSLPDGQMFLTPDIATQMLLPKGTDIFTHNETERMLREGITVDKYSEMIAEQRATRKALQNIEHKSTEITERGLAEYRRRSGMTEKRLDKYFRGKS